jgi:hypothetical protein
LAQPIHRRTSLNDKPGRYGLSASSLLEPDTSRHSCYEADPVLGLRSGIKTTIRRGRKPATWTRIDRDYETLRTGMQDLFHDLGIAVAAA